jgi:hypothetical protein
MTTTTAPSAGLVIAYRYNTDPHLVCATCMNQAVIVFTLAGRDTRATCHGHAPANLAQVRAYAKKNGALMTITEAVVRVRLKAPLATFMEARGMSVRDLQYKVSDRKASWSHGTIGHLRKHTDRAVDPELARRLAKALDVPYGLLF